MYREFVFSIIALCCASAASLGQQVESQNAGKPQPTVPAAAAPSGPVDEGAIFSEGSFAPDGQDFQLGQSGDFITGDFPFHRFWVSGEYLLWTIREAHLPGLASMIPPDGPSSDLFGDNDVSHDMHSGGRFTLGYWWDDSQQSGLEATGFFLGERAVNYSASSAPLARPFSNANTGALDFVEVSSPGVAAGSLVVHFPSEMGGAELNAFKDCYCVDNSCVYGLYFKASALAGFRYLHLGESLDINQQTSVLSSAFNGFSGLAGDQLSIFDHFGTTNDFFGGQIGGELFFQYKDLSLDLRGKVAIGDTSEDITIRGSQTVTTPGGQTTTFNGGLLALPTNIGTYHRDRLAFAPEFDLNVGYDVTHHVSLFVGYTFLGWTQVARPGDQIDPVLDVNNIPNHDPATPSGQVRPAPTLRQTDVFTQGVNFGIGFQW